MSENYKLLYIYKKTNNVPFRTRTLSLKAMELKTVNVYAREFTRFTGRVDYTIQSTVTLCSVLA